MKFHGVNIFFDNDYQWVKPYIYTTEWKQGTWWIYDGTSWKMVGGAGVQAVPFFDSNESPFIEDAYDTQMYVRRLIGTRLKDSNGTYLNDSNNAALFGDYRGT